MLVENTQYQALAHTGTHITVHTCTMHTHNHANIHKLMHIYALAHAHQERKSKPSPSRVVFGHGSCFSLGGHAEEEARVAFCMRTMVAGRSHASVVDRGGPCLSQ